MVDIKRENILEGTAPDYLKERYPTNIPFVDEAFGGGFVPSTTTMFSGDPGAGKTTLLVQIADALVGMGNNVLFNSVEQTKDQVMDLASRIDIDNGFDFQTLSSPKDIILYMEMMRREEPNKQNFIMLDSISRMAAGSRKRAQEISESFIKFCQATRAVGIFIVHTTKNGTFAGNNAMKHDMDAHFHLYVSDMKDDNGLRILQSEKNRYGKKVSKDMMLTERGHVL